MQYARPSSDVENPGGWTTEPLWTKIDEEPFSDADYLTSPKTATGDSFTIGLSGVVDPEVHTGHIIRIRAKTGVTGTFKYELMQGAIVIKDSGDVVLTTAFAEYNMTLSETEAAEITDYSALRIRITAVVTQKNQRQNVSWIRIDVPDTNEKQGSASISGGGSLIATGSKTEGLATDWKAPGTVVNAEIDGKPAWSNPDNAKVLDDNFATVSPSSEDYSDWLRCTNFGFTTDDLPSGAVVEGIEVEIVRKQSSDEEDGGIYLRKSIGGVGDNKAESGAWSSTKEWAYYGGASDNWNAGLTSSDIRTTGFGINISAAGAGGGNGGPADPGKTAYIDHVRIRVFYSLAGEQHSGTGSISGNGSATGTIKKGGLGSAIKSAGGTLLALGLAGMLGIASIVAGGSQLGVGEKSTVGTASISGSGSQVIVGKKETSGSGSVSGGGSLIATGIASEAEQHFGTAFISGNGAVAGVTTKQALGDSPITGGGAVAGSVIKQALCDLVITGDGGVVGIGRKQTSVELSISAGGSIIVTGSAVEFHFGSASISKNGILALVGIKKSSNDVIITDNGDLMLVVSKQARDDSDITGGGSIIAAGEKYEEEGEAHFGVAVVSGNGTLAGAIIKQALADLGISENGVLSGEGVKQALAGLTITGGGSIIISGVAAEWHSGVAVISGNGEIKCTGGKGTDISELIAIKYVGYLK